LPLGDALVDRFAAVLDTVGNLGPAVVVARLRSIELVATVRAVPDGPQFAGLRVMRGILHVAVAV